MATINVIRNKGRVLLLSADNHVATKTSVVQGDPCLQYFPH